MRTKEQKRKDNREYQKRWKERNREAYLKYKREWTRKHRLQNRKVKKNPEQGLWQKISIWSKKMKDGI
jgi:hypothetical protein